MDKQQVNVICHVEKRNGETVTHIEINREPRSPETIPDIAKLFALAVNRAEQYEGHVAMRFVFDGHTIVMMTAPRDVERAHLCVGAILRELTAGLR